MLKMMWGVIVIVINPLAIVILTDPIAIFRGIFKFFLAKKVVKNIIQSVIL